MAFWRFAKNRAPLQPAPATSASWNESATGTKTGQDSALFASIFSVHGVDAAEVIPWQAREVEVGAKRLDARKGTALWQAAWPSISPVQPFGKDEIAQMAPFFDFVFVRPNRELIRQAEYGDFMFIQLGGVVSVERTLEGGQSVRFAETQVGDLIGEMSLLDGGVRFSGCRTLTDCELAVLTLQGLAEMMEEKPMLAAQFVLFLARKLSLRLRVISAKLTDYAESPESLR